MSTDATPLPDDARDMARTLSQTVMDRANDLAVLATAVEKLTDLSVRAGRVAARRPEGWLTKAEIDTALARTISWPGQRRLPYLVAEHLACWTPEMSAAVLELLAVHLAEAVHLDAAARERYLAEPGVQVAVLIARRFLARVLADTSANLRAHLLGRYDQDLWRWWLDHRS